jgi:two-component system, response regulator PdtaR
MFVKPKKATIPGSRPGKLSVAPRLRPRVVFSRDDSLSAAQGPIEQGPILIVEDDYIIASQMESVLIDSGFEIAGIAGSGEEAIELAAAHEPALVVMDIRLRGDRDGVDTALELFASRGIRCIFATAHWTADAQKRAEPARPLAWVPKPYTMPSLVEAVRRGIRDLQRERE